MSIERKISLLKKKLDKIIDTGTLNTERVLELSRELDELIVVYYNLKQS